jgi:NAD(P)-dependent dehydrogenase (short-subunit alcohol dehydrogenase family)
VRAGRDPGDSGRRRPRRELRRLAGAQPARYRGFTSYYVAKAGIIALTEALALELASHQIW